MTKPFSLIRGKNSDIFLKTSKILVLTYNVCSHIPTVGQDLAARVDSTNPKVLDFTPSLKHHLETRQRPVGGRLKNDSFSGECHSVDMPADTQKLARYWNFSWLL